MSNYVSNIDELSELLETNKKYFDEMFKNVDQSIILDEQQRTAVVLDAPNLLVIAGAGSGKTTTMVAKVKYLIDKCNYKESDIVVLSFTKKVKEELENIIHKKFGFKDVTVSTFHSLGLKIINAAGYNCEKIVEESGQYKIFSDYIKNVLFKDKNKFKFFLEAFGNKVYFNSEWKNYSSFDEYHKAAYEEKRKASNFSVEEYNRKQIVNRIKYKKTINGEYMRSKEEAKIANILFVNGIEYEYEKRYSQKIQTSGYYPDFYIKQLEKENYIEHFGIDENGHNDMYTEAQLNNYLKNLRIKQSFFNESFNKDLFIVTYSKYNDKTTYKQNLLRQLKEKGYSFNKRSAQEIYERLQATSQDSYYSRFIDRLLIPFVSLFKQQGFQLKDFDSLIDKTNYSLRNQLIVLKEFFKYYQEELEAKRFIDFEDMIYKAYILMPLIREHRLGVDYKYLIIDEYQDISRQRLDLVKRMSDLFDAKVMAVGDDWQTIFGYSGSRIDLFKNFAKEMDGAKSIPIEKTYRNSQELIDIAGEFILKNEEQITKKLISDKSLKNPVGLLYYDDSDKTKLDFNRAEILNKLIAHLNEQDPKAKILLLGRYKNDVYKIENEELFKVYKEKVIAKKHNDKVLDFLTIHKAKGLGYDYCVLLDLIDDKYGFPSKIEDQPVIKLIRPKLEEDIEYPEERRLFYVALTRTKNRVFMLVPKSRASSFAKEIKNYTNVVAVEFNNSQKK